MPPGNLVGRDEELEAVRLALRQARGGSLAAVWIEGCPGLGRSALLAAAVEEATREGFRVLTGTAHAFEQHWPFALVAELLDLRADDVDPALAALQSDLLRHVERGPDGVDDPAFAKHSVDALLRLPRPALIAIDDVHLADDESIAVLNRVARRARSQPLAVVCSSAPGSRRPRVNGLEEALESLGGTSLSLEPLSSAQVGELVHSTTGACPSDALSEWLEDVAGYPLWAVALVEGLGRTGRLTTNGGVADMDDRTLPATFTRTVATRLRALSAAGADAVETLSFLGSATSPILHAAMGEPAADAGDGLEEPTIAGLIHEREGRWEVVQPLVRAAVYESVPSSARPGKHLAIARRLRRGGAPATVVAEQTLAASRGSGHRMVEDLTVTARELRPDHPALAFRLHERALELVEQRPSDRPEMLEEACEAALEAGLGPAAEDAARALVDTPQPPDARRRALLQLGRALILQRRWCDAVARLCDAREGLAQDDAALPRILAHEALARAWGLDLSGAEECLRAMARIHPLEAGARIAGDAARASLLFLKGDLSGAARVAAEGFPTIEQTGAEPARIRWMYCGMLSFADRHEEADRLLTAGLAGARSQAPGSIPALSYFAAVNAYFRGDWESIPAKLETVSGAPGEGSPDWIAPNVRALEAHLALRRSDVELAHRLCDAVARDARTDPRLSMWFLVVELQLPSADVDRLLDETEATMKRASELGVHYAHWQFALPIADLALRAGRTNLAQDVCALATAVAERNDFASVHAMGAIVSALVEGDPGRARSARAMVGSSPRLVLQADVAEAAGRILLGATEKREGIASLTDALRIYERLGAVRDVERVGAALRRLGVTRRALAKHASPVAAWEGITPAEWRVVELAAQGHTTPAIAERLFVSPRTVQTHLSAVFAKLHVANRAEMAALVNRRMAEQELGRQPGVSVDGRHADRSPR